MFVDSSYSSGPDADQGFAQLFTLLPYFVLDFVLFANWTHCLVTMPSEVECCNALVHTHQYAYDSEQGDVTAEHLRNQYALTRLWAKCVMIILCNSGDVPNSFGKNPLV